MTIEISTKAFTPSFTDSNVKVLIIIRYTIFMEVWELPFESRETERKQYFVEST